MDDLNLSMSWDNLIRFSLPNLTEHHQISYYFVILSVYELYTYTYIYIYTHTHEIRREDSNPGSYSYMS